MNQMEATKNDSKKDYEAYSFGNYTLTESKRDLVRSRKEKHAFDSRVLGDMDSMQEIKSGLDDMI